MAEFVEYRTEQMIPELEELEKLRIYTRKEIRVVLKKRKNFEYQIQKRTKGLVDYTRYIKYEMDVIKLIRLRSVKLRITKKKLSELEMPIAQRISKLFEQGLVRFKQDLTLWTTYIKFTREVKVFGDNSHLIARMLRIHGQKPKLWIMVARWELEDQLSVENARQFILRGLRLHSNSKILHTEAFRLELLNAEMMHQENKYAAASERGRQETVGEIGKSSDSATPTSTCKLSASPSSQEAATSGSDKVLEGRLAQAVYESALKRIHDVSLLISLLEIAEKFNFTAKLQEKIINDLVTHFSDCEVTWNTVARRELQGLAFSSKCAPKKKNSLKEQIIRCFVVYESAVKRVPTEKMWSLFLDALLDLYKDEVHYPKLRKKLLGCTFQNAHNSGLMQEKYYLKWVSFIAGNEKALEDVLLVATQKFPRCVDFWHMRMTLCFRANKSKMGMSVFKSAVSSLGSNSLPLWTNVILFWQAKSPSRVQELFQEGMKQGPKISSNLKPKYLEWLYSTKGIDAAREVYQSLAKEAPYCLALHQKMRQLEFFQLDSSLSNPRNCCELACEQFGAESTDVWIDYIKFENTSGDAKRVSSIHNRALRNLNGNLVDEFLGKFSLLNAGLTDRFL